jgi:NADH:ubiquinone oxidoreductase subunit D
VDIGTVTAQQAKDWGFSGVMLRGSGSSSHISKTIPFFFSLQKKREIRVMFYELLLVFFSVK